MMGWPIPNIDQMIQRIGEKRPKYFGILDLTSGYYQAPLAIESRVFTAFITCIGIYEWLRVPMGLKGAPSYFQQVMATVVLAGILYYLCEIYIDDVVVYASDEETFLQNLDTVFSRFRKHELTINPEKVKLGLPKVEYVGHVLDSIGITFSREKLSELGDFPLPKTAKTLRSFLGLADYFRRHIENYASMELPMRGVLTRYDKSRKFEWTPEAEEAFKAM